MDMPLPSMIIQILQLANQIKGVICTSLVIITAYVKSMKNSLMFSSSVLAS